MCGNAVPNSWHRN